MKSVCPLLLLAAASALELQSELPSNYAYTNKYESSRNFNRLRWRTQGVGAGDIVDRLGWATGTPPTFTTANANWFGGCRLKAAEMYEEYMNTIGQNADATRTPQFRNRSISGLVTYRCEDVAATADGGSQSCYMAATARGYKWDSVAIPNAVGGDAIGGTMMMSIYKPVRFSSTVANYDPNPTEYDLSKYCTIQDHLEATLSTPAGVITPLFINQISSTGLALGTATMRNTQFLSEEFKDPTAVDVLNATWEGSDLINSRYDAASAVMQYGGYAGLTAYDTTASLAKTHGSKDWTDLHAQVPQQIPNVACCKFEQWPKRTYMRYIKRFADRRLALTANTAVQAKTADILAVATAA